MDIEKYHEMEKLEKFHWWFIYRQNILKFVLKKYLSDLDKNAKIVDIGCGTGANIEILNKNYENVTGIDNNDFALEYCKAKNLKNIIKGELPDSIEIDDNSVDLILLFDVLEHIEDDEKSLSVLKNKLKDGGYILLTVPAFSFLWSKHDEGFHHKRRYSLKEIKKMLEMLDFKIIKSSYLYFLLFPIILMIRLLKKNFMSYSQADDFKLNNVFFNNFIVKFLFIEQCLLNYFDYPFGSSILILAKKKE